MINLYPTNAPDPFKPASYERTISVRCGHLNALYSHVQAWNYSPTRYLHIILCFVVWFTLRPLYHIMYLCTLWIAVS